MAERVGPGVWAIQGETITLPVRLAGARLTAAVFPAPPIAARDTLAGTPLLPVVVGGRAFSLLMCVHYGEWALRSYDEVGVGLLVRGPRGRPGLHFLDLPVTGAFTLEAGRDFWSLPKWLMDADLTFGPRATTVTVRDGDDEVMRAEIRHGFRLPAPVRGFVPTWSYLENGAQAGRLLRGRFPMGLDGVQVGRSGVSVRLGGADQHPMAARMRALGMLGRPLATVHADRLSGSLGEFRPVA